MQDGVFSGDTVAADMIAFANYWGIDMQNSWLDQETDPKKKTLWSFMNLLSDDIVEVKDALGVGTSDSL